MILHSPSDCKHNLPFTFCLTTLYKMFTQTLTYRL